MTCENDLPDSSCLSVMLSGQVLTSRTETLEEYLAPRVDHLLVVGLAGVFHKKAVSRCSVYRDGCKVAEKVLPSPHGGGANFLASVFVVPFVFANYLVQIIRCAFSIKESYDIFIGVSCFSAFAGLILKRIRKVRTLVYYSIDYYPPGTGSWFNRFMNRAFYFLDRICASRADIVWHITPRIAEAREKWGKLPASSYRHTDVPLCYPERIVRSAPESEVERWAVGFVGTITESQGLQLLVDAIPNMVNLFPSLRVRVVGDGPYAQSFRRLVNEKGLTGRFVFHGFVTDEEEMMHIISRCAVGVALWPPTEGNNILYADPGKPKLYLCLGVPCVIVRGPAIAAEIEEAAAGRSIDFTNESLVAAVKEIIGNENVWKQYRIRAAALGRKYVSERVLADAMSSILYCCDKGRVENQS